MAILQQLLDDHLDIGHPPTAIAGFVVSDGIKRIRPQFSPSGLRLAMNMFVSPVGLIAYIPTLDNCPIEAYDDRGRCHSHAEIVDGWAVLERGTFATVDGYIVTAGSGSRDYVDTRIYGSEVEALRRAAVVRREYGEVAVMAITVNVERRGSRLAFYDPIIGEL